MDDSVNAVYYSQQVPSSLEVLTVLSLIFDKIYFPGVYIPEHGINEAETKKEIERILSLGKRDIDTIQLINCMKFALHYKYLKDFCIFTGKFGYMGILEEGAERLTMELEELVFGPPPPNFFPSPHIGFAKGLPGDKESAINGPAWLSYPANALIYSVRNGLPLVNDNPSLPVPSLGGVDVRNNAKLLSTILAIECIKMALPKLKPVSPEEIMEFRQQTMEYVKPFRLALLRLSKELNAAIQSDATIEKVQKEASFLVETTVYPELEELKKVINDPAKPWYRRVVDLAKLTPELVTNFISYPTNIAVAKLLGEIASTLADFKDDAEKKQKIMEKGYYYLLRIQKGITP